MGCKTTCLEEVFFVWNGTHEDTMEDYGYEIFYSAAEYDCV